jgi:tetratricopeptide (TPR) repeat protein
MNEFDNAIRFYDSMVTLIKKYQGDESVDYIYSSFGLGAAYFAMEMWEEAMRYNQMCTQSCEKHGKLFEEYGESCYRLGRMEE